MRTSEFFKTLILSRPVNFHKHFLRYAMPCHVKKSFRIMTQFSGNDVDQFLTSKFETKQFLTGSEFTSAFRQICQFSEHTSHWPIRLVKSTAIIQGAVPSRYFSFHFHSATVHSNL